MQPDSAPRDTPDLPSQPGAALVLPPELTIYTTAELHGPWLGWLEAQAGHGGVAPVQAAAVDSADAAGLQLLLALAHALQRQGQRLQLLDPSTALAQACAAIGLQAWLQQHAWADPALANLTPQAAR